MGITTGEFQNYDKNGGGGMRGKNGVNTIRDRIFSGRKIANCISNYEGYLFGMASKETPKKFYKAPSSSFIDYRDITCISCLGHLPVCIIF